MLTLWRRKPEPPPPAGPRGRTLVVGDIHGWSCTFDALLEKIAPTSSDTLITLGDYIDRGPDSRGVIDRLIELSGKCNLVCLRGNHEQMMLYAVKDPTWMTKWRQAGGKATLFSYARHNDVSALKEVPTEHWDFLRNRCVDAHESKTHLFVHAYLAPDLPLEEQSKLMMLSRRFSRPKPHVSGKIWVCGHTVQTDGLPRNAGHAICIDTGVYEGGWLTCLDLESGEYWQANQRSETRKLKLAMSAEGSGKT